MSAHPLFPGMLSSTTYFPSLQQDGFWTAPPSYTLYIETGRLLLAILPNGDTGALKQIFVLEHGCRPCWASDSPSILSLRGYVLKNSGVWTQTKP